MATDYAEIVDAIATMAEGVAEIDEAIEKEADATRLIARSVADAGGTSATIEQGVTTIVQSVRSASTGAHQPDGMASDLRSGAFALSESGSDFLSKVRAA